MGLKKTTSAAKWIGISKGKFTVGKGDEKQEFPAFEGLLIGISFRDAEYEGKKRRDVVLTFLDEEIYKVAINISSGYGKQTLLKLPNVDLSKPFEMAPTHEGTGKQQKTGMFISQQAQPIKQKWTKDNPGPLPQAVQIEVRGETVWDDRAQCKWLEEFTMSTIAPLCAQNLEGNQNVVHDDHASDDAGGGDIPDDAPAPTPAHKEGDIPF